MAGIALAAWLLEGIHYAESASKADTLLTLALISLVYTLLTMILTPIIKAVAFPIYLLTFGLFSVFVSAAMLMLTNYITVTNKIPEFNGGLTVDSYLTAVLGALIIGVVSTFVGGALRKIVG